MEKEQRSKAEFVKNGAPPVLGTGAKRKMGPPQGLHNGAPKVHKPQSVKCPDEGVVITNEFSV